MRLLALLVLGYLLYRVLKSFRSPRSDSRLRGEGGSAPHAAEIDDIMVKDPQCGVYFAKREGVALEHEGKTLYFCSPQCRDRFVQSRSERNEKK